MSRNRKRWRTEGATTWAWGYFVTNCQTAYTYITWDIMKDDNLLGHLNAKVFCTKQNKELACHVPTIFISWQKQQHKLEIQNRKKKGEKKLFKSSHCIRWVKRLFWKMESKSERGCSRFIFVPLKEINFLLELILFPFRQLIEGFLWHFKNGLKILIGEISLKKKIDHIRTEDKAAIAAFLCVPDDPVGLGEGGFVDEELNAEFKAANAEALCVGPS
nr:hypothetical protein Iba_chr04dCG7620 [Ipomoea batatas]